MEYGHMSHFKDEIRKPGIGHCENSAVTHGIDVLLYNILSVVSNPKDVSLDVMHDAFWPAKKPSEIKSLPKSLTIPVHP